MKVLIQACSSSKDLLVQAERLGGHLESYSHHIEITTKAHPLRLFMRPYDVVYLLLDRTSISFRDYLLPHLAAPLGACTMLSYLGEGSDLIDRLSWTRWTLQFFDGVSVPNLEMYKKIRFYQKKKWIWPGVIDYKPNGLAGDIEKANLILIPCLRNFEELLQLPVAVNQSVAVDGTFLRTQEAHLTLRQRWTKFTKAHPVWANIPLIIESRNRAALTQGSSVFYKFNHLSISAINQIRLIEDCVAHDWIPIMTESQASGLADFWINGENCLIHENSPKIHFEEGHCEGAQFSLSSSRQHFQRAQESKLNELNRIMATLAQNKRTQIEYANMSYRP
jgi:hypothetical protein